VLFAFFFGFLVIMVIWAWVETGGSNRPCSAAGRKPRRQEAPGGNTRATVAPTMPSLPLPSRC
jgi:hypothetical protein